MHETQAQNKRHLGDIVDALMSEARDTTDTFEDIPLDFRHHEARVRKKKVKQPVSFPKEWRMTVGRRMELEARRKEALQRDLEGVVVDGGKLLEDVANLPQQQEQRALFRDNAPARRASGPIGNMRSQRGATPLRL